MKLGILTLPLHTNYGGILQAYALQTVLERQGHDIRIINLPVREVGKKALIITCLRRFMANCLLRKRKPLRAWPNAHEMEVMNRYTREFVKRRLKVVECEEASLLYDLSVREKLAGYVVGSDQVWRPGYTPDLPAYFLDFLHDKRYKRVAYAASFGVDAWEFSPELTRRCAGLVQLFDAVSVREKSGVGLCREHLGKEASWVVDPTLLLDKGDYLRLLPRAGVGKVRNRSHLMVYMLDKNAEKEDWISKIAENKKLAVHSVCAQAKFWDVGKKGLDACVAPPVEDWISGFSNAEYVITDSFHGTVFAILFHKPFICIVNSSRGAARFTSLLQVLGLEERMFSENGVFDAGIVDKPIDYDAVDVLLAAEREKAFAFLADALS